MKTPTISFLSARPWCRAGLLFVATVLSSCKDDVLTEVPLSFLNPSVVLTGKAGFESAITGLHAAAREEIFLTPNSQNHAMNLGTDAYMNADNGITFKDLSTMLTPTNGAVNQWWEWAFLKMIPRANTVIKFAEQPTANLANEAEKNAIIAEARFFRAYTYNILANLYGGVPIVAEVATAPKLDYTRATRQQVLDFARQDLEFASQWLPKTTRQPGRIVKAAADHMLAEVFISLSNNDKAIEAASAVINDGLHKLVTARFGTKLAQPGDAFSDLFRDNNYNLAANTETIWALQFEFQTPGGVTYVASSGEFGGNTSMRAFGAAYWKLLDPDGKAGMVPADSLGYPVGWVMGTAYASYDIWKEDWNDMRNSSYNIRRVYYYNNPASKFFRQRVDPVKAKVDTVNSGAYYPTSRKIEGDALSGATAGRTYQDFYKMRLAETYLLRAEAYLRKGDKQRAADDLNVLHARAKAKPVTADRATLDYILDERVKELIVEEPRRRTLARFSLLGNPTLMVDRVKKYNPKSGGTINVKHTLFPIPQRFIDANIGAPIEQNPGY